jgi:hypothetical protein
MPTGWETTGSRKVLGVPGQIVASVKNINASKIRHIWRDCVFREEHSTGNIMLSNEV